MDYKRIAVLGGGNGGHAMAADLTVRGFKVSFFELPRFYENVKTVMDTKRIKITGVLQDTIELFDATNDIQRALKDCKYIFIAVPAFGHRVYAELLAPYLTEEHLVVLWPGTFGALEFRKVLTECNNTKPVTIADCDTLPYIARLESPGVVNIGNIENSTELGVLPASKTSEVQEKMHGVFNVSFLKNVLECGFASANPVMHTGAFVLNIGRIEYQARRAFYFYEEGYTPSTAKVCEQVDEERRKLAASYGYTLPDIATVLYECGDGPKGTLLECIKGSYSLTHVCGPNTTDSRYLKEDVPYGLVPWIELAGVVQTPTPTMEALVHIVNVIFNTDYYKYGRNLVSLGLGNMSREQILDFVETGIK